MFAHLKDFALLFVPELDVHGVGAGQEQGWFFSLEITVVWFLPHSKFLPNSFLRAIRFIFDSMTNVDTLGGLVHRCISPTSG